MVHAVELHNVSKSFGNFSAVDRLSLGVPSGSIYGFIGPNGSGKTTTLRMITRIYSPDEGTVSVLGSLNHALNDDRVGYLPEERGIYESMKVKDLLRFYARLKGHEPAQHELEGWCDRIELTGVLARKVQTLSKGQKQKIQFLATVISKPELLLLDEPFSGLDPVNGVVIRQLIQQLRSDGATIIFSTHDMRTAEELCDFVFMIHKGQKVLDGTLESIKSQYGGDLVRVRMRDRKQSLTDLPGVSEVIDRGETLELRTRSDIDSNRLLLELAARGTVEHFELAKPTLHDIFIRIAGGH
jgi:ABC-2 type transport system ATP-binding protein